MPERENAGPHRTFVDDPPTSSKEIIRYGLSMAVVASLGAGVALWSGRVAPETDATDVDNAVTVDLPPAEASSRPTSDAAEGPQQQAAQASPAQQAPQTVEPPKPVDKPSDEPKVEPSEKQLDTPPPVAPDAAAAVLDRKQDEVVPPPPAAAPATQAQDALAPAGSDTPTKTDAEDDEEGRPPPSSHEITVWQRALMRRLEAAKREVTREPHGSGTVKVAFEIDGKGALSSEHVAQSSGSSSLDKAALLLIRRAAPFPAPPSHAATRDTSFVVPVRFR